VPDISFRASTDVLPWLGVGLLLIALTAGALSREPFSRAESWQRWASRSVVVGAVLYACGHAFRQFLSGAWEPAVPLGLLLSVASLLVLGGSLLRTRLLPSGVGAAVLLSALLLLAFNDQYLTAWLSVPFGAIWTLLGLYLLRQNVATKRVRLT
jgi:drug/metabolite transporter (DMT)-like permease